MHVAIIGWGRGWLVSRTAPVGITQRCVRRDLRVALVGNEVRALDSRECFPHKQ